MTHSPCKDCPDRVLGCHSVCEKYNNWHALHVEKLKKEKLSRPKQITKYDFTGTSPKPGKHRRTRGTKH